MKLNTLLFSTLLVVSFLFSCSTETQDNTNVDLSNLKIDLDLEVFKEGAILFNYNSKVELLDKIDKSIEFLVSDIKALEDKNIKTNETIINIKFSNGKALITDYIVYDIKTGKPIENHKLNSNTQTSYNQTQTEMYGACPDGYKLLAKCGNFSGTEQCISNAISKYLKKNITSVGDCANVQIKVGALNTKVCGKQC